VPATLLKHVFRDGFDIVCDFAKSRDSFLADARDGRRWLDFHGFRGSSALGYNHPALVDGALLSRLGRAAVHEPSQADFASIELAELVQALSYAAIPEDLPRLCLVEDPERAINEALKAAFDWKSRKNLERGLEEGSACSVLHFRQAFHGTSGYGLSLTNTGDPALTRHYPRHDWPRAPNPYARFPLEGASLRDTEDREIQAVADVRSALRERPHRIAAVVIEPIQGEGGDNHFRAEFLRELRRACDEFEALLVFDEMGTGIAATGRFWCHEHFEVRPDLLVFGARLGLGGVLGSRRLDQVEDGAFTERGRLGSSRGVSPVSALRAARIVDTVAADELAKAADEGGKTLLGGLGMIADRDDRMTNVRGRGLIVAFDLPSGEIRDRFLSGLRDKGLLALPGGLRSVRFRPPLSAKKDELDHGLGLVHDVLKAMK
jgi:L-lysine 6-transaminase